MESMNFKSLNVKNFGSWADLDVPLGDQGIVYIQGKTGSGKSTIFNAIQWALVGEEGKKITADSVVNRWRKKNCRVALYFDDYKINMGRKPNFLELYRGGEPLTMKSVPETRKLVMDVLGMSKEAFLNILMVSGDDNTRFLNMTPSVRKKLFDQFVTMQWVESCIKVSRESVVDINSKVDRVDGKLELLKSKKAELEKVLSKRVTPVYPATLNALGLAKEKLYNRIADISVIVGQLKWELESYEKERRSLKSNNSKFRDGLKACPTCLRVIQTGEVGIIDSLCRLRLKKVDEGARKVFTGLMNEEGNLKNAEKDLEEVCNEILELKSKVGTAKVVYNAKKIELSEVREKLALYESRRKQLAELGFYHSIWKEKGWPEVKSYFYRDTLGLLNCELSLLTPYYRDISITLDIGKNGDIIEHIEHPKGGETYGSLSGGEQRCLDLVMAMAFQRLSSISGSTPNILLIDEVFDKIDVDRIDQSINMLKSFDRSSIFVISHRKELMDYFFNVWRVVKRRGFSEIVN